MPTIYRSMKRAEDGLPVVGVNSKELGFRVPPNPDADVALDGDDRVHIDGKGMSVAEHWRFMPGHLVPKRLVPFCPGATGSNRLACYKLGEGPFEEAPLNDELQLVLKTHDPHLGNVAPVEAVPIQRFQGALAATRAHWQPDETQP